VSAKQPNQEVKRTVGLYIRPSATKITTFSVESLIRGEISTKLDAASALHFGWESKKDHANSVNKFSTIGNKLLTS
jgi:hypothetical protein